MDGIRVLFDGEVKEITREKAFDFFSVIFPQGIILTTMGDKVGLSVPPREGEDGEGK